MSAVMNINTGIAQIAYQLGRLSAEVESVHTCALAHYRYPWPLDPQCKGCLHRIEQFVEKNHLELPYKLFGVEVILDHLVADHNRRIEKAKAWREMGSGI